MARSCRVLNFDFGERDVCSLYGEFWEKNAGVGGILGLFYGNYDKKRYGFMK